MFADLLVQLETSSLAQGLRFSIWIYPLVNAAHLAGIALLIGSIVPLDLRLLGIWRSVPLSGLWRILTRTAMMGLFIAVLFGLLLFATDATAYAASPLFRAKMALIAVGGVNAVFARRYALRGDLSSAGVKVVALVSLGTWCTTLVIGRLLGYF